MSEEKTIPQVSFDILHPQPLFIVISGPAGVGKDAVLNEFKKMDLPMHFVVTATSRPPRPGEVHGVDYFFVSREQFEEMIRRNELVEYARVYDDYKGIPRRQIDQAIQSGKDVIIRVDVQGSAKLRSLYPEAVLIFLIPENEEEWHSRLRNRNTESPESYRLRLETIRKELEKIDLFDYIVVNAHAKLDQAVSIILAIIMAEHHRRNPRRLSGSPERAN